MSEIPTPQEWDKVREQHIRVRRNRAHIEAADFVEMVVTRMVQEGTTWFDVPNHPYGLARGIVRYLFAEKGWELEFHSCGPEKSIKLSPCKIGTTRRRGIWPFRRTERFTKYGTWERVEAREAAQEP